MTDLHNSDKEFKFTIRSLITKTCPYCGVKLEKIPKRKKKCPECGNYIFVKQGKLYTEEEKKDEIKWHQKFKPYTGNDHAEFNEGDWKITEDDIERAIKRWDKTMPEYKGLLDADIEKGDDD